MSLWVLPIELYQRWADCKASHGGALYSDFQKKLEQLVKRIVSMKVSYKNMINIWFKSKCIIKKIIKIFQIKMVNFTKKRKSSPTHIESVLLPHWKQNVVRDKTRKSLIDLLDSAAFA